MALIDQPLCSFSSTALPMEPVLVLEWHGEEAVSRLYRFEIRLASKNPLFDDESLLGNPATLSLTDAAGLAHSYHGLVTEVEQLDGDGEYFYFRVVLEPRVARLKQFRFSEIWLDKSLPDLIRDVLSDTDLVREGPGTSGAEAGDYDFDIRLASGDLALNESSFTCQFGETSFDFLSRLLEYYGVYYFFEQQGDHEALVFCGDRRFQAQSETLLSYRPIDTALDVEQGVPFARTFKRRLASQPKQMVLQDFSATNAQLTLQTMASVASASLPTDASADALAQADGSPAFFGDMGVYGEHFGSIDEGQALATLRAQALGCRHREFHGAGRAASVRAGQVIRMIGHPRISLNDAYYVIEVQHDGSQPLPGLGQDQAGTAGDTNTRFVALPAQVQYRPLISTPKPNVQGLMTAIIDGDDDSDRPLLNENGCYKVTFPFVRSDKPDTRGSAWLRLATMSSGSNHGMHFPLLKGTEVLVSFLGGDPDRPIITGAVPNSENPNMVNSSNATHSGLATPGGHYLAMEDDARGPLMTMGAPGGDTSFTMGNGQVTGAHLQTAAHMQLSSSSLYHEVPGIFSSKVGSGDPDSFVHSDSNSGANPQMLGSPLKPPAPPADDPDGSAAQQAVDQGQNSRITALEPTWNYVNQKWKLPGNTKAGNWVSKNFNLGAKIDYNQTRTFKIDLASAFLQASASLGAGKLELGVQGISSSVKMSGPAWDLKINAKNYGYSNFKKDVSPEELIKTLSQRVDTGFADLRTEMRAIQTGIYDLKATASCSLQVGDATITVLPESVTIYAPEPIVLMGGAIVMGDLVVNGQVVAASVSADATVTALGEVKGATVSCGVLTATEANLTEPYVPPMLNTLLMESIEVVAGIKSLEIAMDGVKAGLKEVNDVIQAPLEESGPMSDDYMAMFV
ncbi:type VI secretion system Vgr family protein [Pseudomonas sp. NPDC086278]|uniref:type VI secretion system Vgr family protein n=1 Tax=Pseudomonas sp. NPDC086278 TaxID=3390646 RepID=UPI003D03558C